MINKTCLYACVLTGSVLGATSASGQTIPNVAVAAPGAVAPSPSFMDGFSKGNFYLGAAGAATFISPPHGFATALNARGGEHWHPGFAAGGVAGWAFSNGLMLDLAVVYAGNSADKITTATGAFRQTGTQGTMAALAEAYYALPLPKLGINTMAVVPYVGVGVGPTWSHVRTKVYFPDGSINRPHGNSGANFTYEVIGGLAFPIPGLKNTVGLIDYRYLGVVNATNLRQTYEPAGGGGTISGPVVPSGYIAGHVIAIGISHNF